MASARWIQCESVTSELGFLAKHPTTSALVDLDEEKEKALNIALNKISGDSTKAETFEILMNGVKAISEFTGAKPVYRKTPTYAYQIDYFTVTREGMV